MELGGNGLCHCAAEKTNGHPTPEQERITAQRQSETIGKHSPVQVRLVGVPYKLLTRCRWAMQQVKVTANSGKKTKTKPVVAALWINAG